MRFVVRADASEILGSGHVARCLTLAQALRRQGGEVGFVCRQAVGDMRQAIVAAGFDCHVLPGADEFDAVADAAATARIVDELGDADWLIVDHYRIDRVWETALRARVGHLLVIDDLADRDHDCDVLLDPNFRSGDADVLWRPRLPAHCRLLHGPRFALLREEFLHERERLRERDGVVRRILVSCGGADRDGAALLAVAALQVLHRQGLLQGVVIDVIAGAANPHAEPLRERTMALPGAVFSLSADNMAERMAMADLAIGAGGGTTWERCYLGLPALAIVIADNQRAATAAVAAVGAQYDLGPLPALDVQTLAARIGACLAESSALRAMSARARAVMGEVDFIRYPLDWLSHGRQNPES